MSDLALILTDFIPAPSQPEQVPPRLAALELWLARGHHSTPGRDWRAWLARRYGGPELGALSSAALAARAAGVAESAAPAGRWLATPVHYFAGLDSVHLHPLGLLHLGEEEQRTLVTQFAQLWADSPWRLHALGQRELLLSGPVLDADGADPALWLGEDPTPGLPRGREAGQLRRLGAELEMWLHEHPLNLARAERGLLPVTTLWPWGGSAVTASSSPPRSGQLHGADSVAAAVWRARGQAAAPAAAALSELGPATGDEVVLLSLVQPQGLTATLREWEERWFAPAIAALRAGRYTTLWLWAGTHLYALRRRDLWRFWCGAQPWWERWA